MRNLKLIREEEKEKEQSVRDFISYVLKINPQIAYICGEKPILARQNRETLNRFAKELVIRSHEILDLMEW